MTQKWNGVYYNITSKHHTMRYYATKCLYNETSAKKNNHCEIWIQEYRLCIIQSLCKPLKKHPLTTAPFTWIHWNKFSFHNPFFVASTGAASGGSTGGLVFRFFKPFFFIAMARWLTPLMGFKWWAINEWNCCVVVGLSNWWMWLSSAFRWDKWGCYNVDFTRTSVK